MSPRTLPNKLMYVGLAFFAIAAYATRCHMGYMNDDTFMFLATMSPWLFMGITTGLCFVAGVLMPQRAFKHRLVLRTGVGIAAGAAMPWIAHAYLDLRGNPDAMSKIELFVPAAITFILAGAVYAIGDKIATRTTATATATRIDATRAS